MYTPDTKERLGVYVVSSNISEVAPEAVKDSSVIEEGPIALFKFRDPDGNMVEYYSLSYK
jgi:hypothetical protein